MSGEPVAEAPGHPEVVRIVAPNPGPMTLDGTNTYVVGSAPAWVIDPGPAEEDHIAAVRELAEARGGIGGVVLTHSHLDHNAGVELLGAGLALGHADGFDDIAAIRGEGIEPPPALASREGERVGPFIAYSTPGHASDHVVFALDEGESGNVVFCGDLVLGAGSTIVPPSSGGGSLADYMASLELLDSLGATLLCPGHGPPITDPAAKLAEYAAHRRERERLLVAALAAGGRSTDELLDAAWSDVPEPLRPAAALALRAHLEKLEAEGRLPAGLEP